ncbi:hypothetical protein PsorP6_018089 [Peronosclerospora sorghi]|uniref:Uncharacterized protein n=1 Tax=Peronosclerospora sorghi TaxID=230839 RepID=A0ACC0WC37_9STRA|nr:hypothetical protein PsorP6_018089 [Peronosclerospora sorghi]
MRTLPEETAPRGVTFLRDCYVELHAMQRKVVEQSVPYYGIDLVPEPGRARATRSSAGHGPCARRRRNVRLMKCTALAPKWVADDSRACVKRRTNARASRWPSRSFAKRTLASREKELVRTEIAIFKLVQHPHMIRLVDVYEDCKCLLSCHGARGTGSTLFHGLVGRARSAEADARLVMHALFASVHDFHRVGIVHHDLKPENSLCGETLHDGKLADSGLSTLVDPHEVRTVPCGTLH